MNSPLEQRVLLQLDSIETEMLKLGLQSNERPSDEAFASTVPFCYDQMLFTEWLQWVLLPKTRDMITQGQPLPTSCDIAPLAEEEFKQIPKDTQKLLALIQGFDTLLTR